jgi:uncharacterized protein YciI
MMRRMLRMTALITLILTSFVAGGSSAKGQQKQSQFVGIAKPTNPDLFKKGPRPEDLPVFQQQAEYWQKLIEQGVCMVAGHTLNHDETAFGLAIVRADSESAAREIMERSPLVHAGLLRVTLFPFEGLAGKTVQAAVFRESSLQTSEKANVLRREPRTN